MQLFLYGGLLLGAAALCGWWTKNDLRRGETRLDLWMRPRHSDAPALFWMVVIGQGSLAALLLLGGLGLIVLGLLKFL